MPRYGFEVVVEVTTDYNRRIDVLAEDVLYDFDDPDCSVLRIKTVTPFQVAIENLDRLRPCVESRPAEVGTECLDQRESYIVGVSYRVWYDQWLLKYRSYCNFVSFMQTTCGCSFSTTLAKASCFSPPLIPLMLVFINTISSRAGSWLVGTGFVLTSFCSLLPLVGRVSA